MDPRYKSRFNENILQEALRRYGVAPADAEALDGFESFIYQIRRGGQENILRIGHAHRRSANLIRGEVDWINYLADHFGPSMQNVATTARAVPSDQGNLVEALADGEGDYFLATAFAKARGHSPRWNQVTSELNEHYGQLLGRMHALAQVYQPPNAAWTRPQWDDPIMFSAEEFLPTDESAVRDQLCQLHERLAALPRNDRSAYGLIHQDAHPGNFFVDDNAFITLFDFDDCCYGWFAYDIAMVIFYVCMHEADPATYCREFMGSFLAGYRRENQISPDWLRQIPDFLKLREIDLYAVIHRSFDVNNLTDRWVSWYMRGRKEHIEQGLPFIAFDYDLGSL